MRLLVAASLTILPAAAGAVDTGSGQVMKGAIPPSSKDCPRPTGYYAYRGDQPPKPRKLTELPPATAYMAVYRTINGCEVPLTIIEYRSGRGR